jgi:nitroreductase
MTKDKYVEEVIKKRRSSRAFTDEKLTEEELNRIIDAGIAAPSGSNSQNQRFIVVTNTEEIERIGKNRFVWPYKKADHAKIRSIKPAGILGNATALILVFADASVTEGRNMGEYYIWEALQTQNCSASIENMLIMSTAMGIGSCWVSASDKMNYSRMLSGKSWRQTLSDYEITPTMKMQGVVILGRPKQLDDDGYPVGEKLHGATVWRSVERQFREFYIVNKAKDIEVEPLSFFEKARLRILSKLMSLVLAFMKVLDQRIWKIELQNERYAQSKYNEGQ